MEYPLLTGVILAANIAGLPNEEVTIQVSRNGDFMTFQGTVGSCVANDAGEGYGFIGIERSKFSTVKSGPIDALGKTAEQFGLLYFRDNKRFGEFLQSFRARRFLLRSS